MEVKDLVAEKLVTSVAHNRKGERCGKAQKRVIVYGNACRVFKRCFSELWTHLPGLCGSIGFRRESDHACLRRAQARVSEPWLDAPRGSTREHRVDPTNAAADTREIEVAIPKLHYESDSTKIISFPEQYCSGSAARRARQIAGNHCMRCIPTHAKPHP